MKLNLKTYHTTETSKSCHDNRIQIENISYQLYYAFQREKNNNSHINLCRQWLIWLKHDVCQPEFVNDEKKGEIIERQG